MSADEAEQEAILARQRLGLGRFNPFSQTILTTGQPQPVEPTRPVKPLTEAEQAADDARRKLRIGKYNPFSKKLFKQRIIKHDNLR
jgi:hypothetical protein